MKSARFTPHASIRPPNSSRVNSAASTNADSVMPATPGGTPYVSIANSVIFTMMR